METGGDVRILGVDPGTRATGYGVVELQGSQLRRVAGGVIRARASASLGARLAGIHAELSRVIERFGPDSTAVENVFSGRNPRSALTLGHARGVALAAFAASGLETGEYSPAQVKLAVVGYGAAAKPQVQRMVQRLLDLADLPPADEADALAIAICHGHSVRPVRARPVVSAP
jgi:crossover junction endodeoxyribonuclease RuvC